MVLSFYVKLLVIILSIQSGRTTWKSSFGLWNNASLPDLPTPFTNVTQDEDVLRQYCPTSYCGFNASETENTTLIVLDRTPDTVCCKPCDCSDRCYELGNCCYDKEFFRLPRYDSWGEQREFCTQTYIFNTTLFPDELRSSYLLYKHCNTTDNVSLIAKCHNEDRESTTDMLPVYSVRTDRHYRNIYCAMCNNEIMVDLINWNHELRCSSVLDFMLLMPFSQVFFETDGRVAIVRTLMSGLIPCVSYFKPPGGTHATTYLHPQHMIANCHNDSTDYSRLEEKCTTYHSPVYTRTDIFKNVFCMMCNEQLNPFNQYSDCSDNSSQSIFPTLSVTALLSLDEAFPEGYDEDSTDHQSRCTPPAVFNGDINECLTMQCSLEKLSIGERCFGLYRSLSNINLDFWVLVKYPASVQYNHDDILNEVSTLFSQERPMTICKSSIKGVHVVDNDLITHVQIVVHARTQTNLKRTFMAFVNKIDKYNANTSGVYKMEAGQDVLFPLAPDTLHLFPYVDELGTRCEGIAMSGLLFCPIIALTAFTYLDNSSVDVGGLLFEPHEYVLSFGPQADVVFEQVFICLDTYISRHKLAYQQNLTNGSGKHSSVLLTIEVFGFLVYGLGKHGNNM